MKHDSAMLTKPFLTAKNLHREWACFPKRLINQVVKIFSTERFAGSLDGNVVILFGKISNFSLPKRTLSSCELIRRQNLITP